MAFRALIVSLLFPAFLVVTACNNQTDATHGGAGNTAATVTTTTVDVREWRDEIEAVGSLQANESVLLSAKITETVRRINFTDGQQVEAGDVLVELTSGQQVAALQEAQAAYKDTSQQFARTEDLADKGTVSKAAFDTVRANRDGAQARVNALRAQLSDRVITAPFPGVLGLRQISPGALVTPGTPIVTLDDIAVMKLDFAVPEALMSRLAVGQPITSRSVAWPELEFSGYTVGIDTRVDPVTRAVTVRALIENPQMQLRPGMLMSVQLSQEPRQALIIPELSIEQVGNESFVYRIDDGMRVERVRVSLGARARGEVEVIAGLEEGDQIVVEGIVKLRDGSVVKPVGAFGGSVQAAAPDAAVLN